MLVRAAFRLDIAECLALDTSYETDCVWQVEQRDDGSGVTITLRQVKLPHPIELKYPSPGAELAARWERQACVLVAEPEGRVRGYVDMSAYRDQGLGFVHNLVVDRSFRRRGLATALARETMRWAHQRSLRRVMVAVQSKNHPAVQFCRQLGFAFCGFNDRYFVNRDIALFYCLKVS
jgi:ribosomal protein S18 acetylase RimI-like enzyme